MPLMRRIPKRGFNQSRFRTPFSVVSLSDLQALNTSEVTPKSLAAAGIIRDEFCRVKVLANGVLTRSVHISGCSASCSARAAVLAAGGSVS